MTFAGEAAMVPGSVWSRTVGGRASPSCRANAGMRTVGGSSMSGAASDHPSRSAWVMRPAVTHSRSSRMAPASL